MLEDPEFPSRTEGLAERDPKGMKALMESDKSTREWLINRVGARLGVPLKTGVTLAAASMLAAQLQLFYAGRGSLSHRDLKSARLANLDESRIQWGMGPSKVLFSPDEVGVKRKRVRGVVGDKGGVTLCLVIDVQKILLAQIIIKGKKGQLSKNVRNLPHHKWQFVFFDAQPASWQDTNTMERIMSRLGSVASNLILAADNFGPHFAASVKAVAARNNNELRPLVPNATSYQQALDQMFKEVKRLIKGEFLRHLLKQAALRCHARSTDKLPHPTYEELGDIVEQVCIQLNTTDIVARSWRLCGLGPGATFEGMNSGLRELLSIEPTPDARAAALQKANLPATTIVPWGKCQDLLREVEVVEDDSIEDINLLSIEDPPQAAQLTAVGQLLNIAVDDVPQVAEPAPPPESTAHVPAGDSPATAPEPAHPARGGKTRAQAPPSQSDQSQATATRSGCIVRRPPGLEYLDNLRQHV